VDRNFEGEAFASRQSNAMDMHHVAVVGAHAVDAIDFDFDVGRGVIHRDLDRGSRHASGSRRCSAEKFNARGDWPARLGRGGGSQGEKDAGGAYE
jgi:hypothetical protein